MSVDDIFGDVSAASRRLARRDAGLRRAVRSIGAPVIRRRPGGFAGLFRIIVEQQVSVPSAQAILARCDEGLPAWTPDAVLAAGDDALRACGLSGPKARYVAGLAEAVLQGVLDLDRLAHDDDEEAMARLVAIKGVGPWTASIYLLFCEGRVDIWPPKDVALKHAYNHAREDSLSQAEVDMKATDFAPFRGLAAHILWTYYAQIRGRSPI